VPIKCRLSVADYVLWPDPACRPCIAGGGNVHANPEGSLRLIDRKYDWRVLSPGVEACKNAFDRHAALFVPSIPRPSGWIPGPSSPSNPEPLFLTGIPVPDETTPNPHEGDSARMPALAIVCLSRAGKLGPFFKCLYFHIIVMQQLLLYTAFFKN